MYYENEIVNFSRILVFSGPDLSLCSSGRSCALGTEVWQGFFIFHDATFGSAVVLLAGEWHTAGASPSLCVLYCPCPAGVPLGHKQDFVPCSALFAALPSEAWSGSLSCAAWRLHLADMTQSQMQQLLLSPRTFFKWVKVL